MSSVITKDATGEFTETWTKERFVVTTWTLDFWTRKASDRVTREVEAYSNDTAIDVAVDEFICDIPEVTELRRVWEVANVADVQAANDAMEDYTPFSCNTRMVFADDVFTR